MPFVIEQQDGKRRRIELDGRGLPYPSGVRWGGEQRLESTWLPGSPDAVVQLFGPKERDQSIEGRWATDRMGGDSPSCIVRVDGRQLPTALEAAQLLDLVRIEGMLLRVSYESEVRYGFLRSFEYGPMPEGRTLLRIDWQAQFEWASRNGQMAAPAIPSRLGTSLLSNRLAILAQQVESVDVEMRGQADALRSRLAEPVATLRKTAAAAANLAASWVQRASSAASTAQGTIGITNEVLVSHYAIAGAAQSVAYSQVASRQEFAPVPGRVGGVQSDAGLGSTVVVARDARRMLRLARDLAALGDSVAASTAAALHETEPQVAYAMRGEDLRDVAQRVLGSADAWRDVAAVNGLAGSEVSPGFGLLIPTARRQLLTET
ncbi:MAG: hypothetical protein E6Q97_33520 [Desulfurellales bacterium]|nr:MAG: hypothetical protein E6Q97_33520 [Desulfurellales bacterium]